VNGRSIVEVAMERWKSSFKWKIEEIYADRLMSYKEAIALRDYEDSVFNDIVKKYSEQCRFYHTLEHVLFCVDRLYGASSIVEDFNAVEIALWFHDIVYKPKAVDNEIRSAEHARRFTSQLYSFGCPIDDEDLDENDPKFLAAMKKSDTVYKLVMATDHKPMTVMTNDEMVVRDIDLCVFGQEWDKFKKYDDDIRAEYSWVPETDYRNGRARILQSFVSREHIYDTEFFRSRYEEKARENLQKAIEGLKGATI
jgi:predicted metal-dependent HD superfamily phosphohydrolase